MIKVAEMQYSLHVRLPAAIAYLQDRGCALSVLVASSKDVVANCIICTQARGAVTSIRVEFSETTISVCFSKELRGSGAAYELHAPNASIEAGQLNFGSKARWINHPGISAALSREYASQVRSEWVDKPKFSSEVVDETGAITAAGFRVAQLGALHAIAAHWSVKSSHAKVVLPTGTGKTDVMIAAMLLQQAERTLILVPSDALRTQTIKNVSTLGKLREISAIPDSAFNPAVGVFLNSPGSVLDVELLRSTNVVVSTVQMLLEIGDRDLQDILSLFDLVIFDEAHHLPAASWTRISRLISSDAKSLSLTATPYRNDGRRVPGELIYQFPLKLAQQLGYFSKIDIVRIDESDPDAADLQIADAAVEALRADEENSGFRHLIMARAKTQEHAGRLFDIYRTRYPELNPVLLHSRIRVSERRSALESVRSLLSRVVVCVDMLGEGVDIPALKIAALHDSHRSLPITLQFIGRFTRSSQVAGSATVVINIAEPMTGTAIAELFAEDADWNDIVPALSMRATGQAEAATQFLSSMRAFVDPDERKFDLGLISARTGASIFRTSSFQPGRIESALSKASRLHQSWLNEDRNLVIFVTHDLTQPSWSTSREAVSFEWNLTLALFDREQGRLYINSTYADSRVAKLAQALGGPHARLVDGEKMFRVFSGLRRAVLYNVGLRRRGQLRFQMLAGLDIGGQVRADVQAGSTKSNLYAAGYEDGAKVNVGASARGRIWSLTNLSVLEWREWCRKMSSKILDDSIATDSFLQYTLIAREIQSLPTIRPFACVPPDELIPGVSSTGHAISCQGTSARFTEMDLSLDTVDVDENAMLVNLSLGEVTGLQMRMRWGPFTVSQISGPKISIMDGKDQFDLDEFLCTHPPAVLMCDGSEIIGKDHFAYPSTFPYTFSRESILVLDWSGVPLNRESKWSRGVERDASIQGHMIDKLLEGSAAIIFDDDDSGEVADIVVLDEKPETHELDVILYHCKYSSGAGAGARVDDLYEVCGQAVKSARMMHKPDALLLHLIQRERRLGGRPSRFERGSIDQLRSLRRRLSSYRANLNICIVQPGLSASALTPELSSILGAADGFVREFTGRGMRVFGSS